MPKLNRLNYSMMEQVMETLVAKGINTSRYKIHKTPFKLNYNLPAIKCCQLRCGVNIKIVKETTITGRTVYSFHGKLKYIHRGMFH